MDANPLGVREFLKTRLSAPMFERLRAASKDFSLPVFRRDPASGAYECTLDAEFADDDEEFIDAACIASELLTASGLDFAGDQTVWSETEEKGEVRLEFRFGPDEAMVFEEFRRQLRTADQKTAGIHADARTRPDGYVVSIRLLYENDFDYQRKKDSIEWMLHLARKKANNSPFSGWKL